MALITVKAHEGEDSRDEQPETGPHIAGEELGSSQDSHMDTDELPPGQGFLPFRGRWEAVPLENIPHRLVAERIAQVSQRTNDAVIAP
jgi:hypothetical protein